MITILIADDHVMVRQGLRSLLESEPSFSVIGETGDGLDCVRRVEELKPNVLILDLNMPGLSGFEVISQVTRRVPQTLIVVQSMFTQEAYVRRAMENGAKAFVVKDDSAEALIRAVRDVVAGRTFLSKSVLQKTSCRVGEPDDPYDTLTEREREVLSLISDGLAGPDIAERLFISKRTVDKHRSNLMEKLNIHNERSLVRFALERGITLPSGESAIETVGLSVRSESISTLVVDDNDEFRTQLIRFLETFGFFTVVGSASDGGAAIEAASKLHPELVLLDIRMKPVDGLTALPTIKSVSPETHVIMLSLLNESVYTERALTEGASGFIAKSELLECLLPEVRKVFGESRIP